jgi:paraquat-inducible protein B
MAPKLVELLGQSRQTLAATKSVLDGNAPLQRDLRVTLSEVGGAARSLRLLTESLEQHPESLLRGKKGD